MPPAKAPMLGMLYQFESTQWLPPEQLRRMQLGQAAQLCAHARRQSRFWRERLASAARWRDIPILGRADIQRAGEELHCANYPKSHGPIRKISTSGSTGQSVVVHTNALTDFFYNVISLREHMWHKYDFSGSFMVSRMFDKPVPEGMTLPNWGDPHRQFFKTGPCALINIVSDIEYQARRILEFNPHYLLTYPSNLKGLLEYFKANSARPANLRAIKTIGELLWPEIRQLCAEVLGARIHDTYSSQEVGYIAIQCPDTGNYHIQAENVLVEILDDDNRPCQPGQSGRVIITALHNFSTPIIRYELGDMAMVAPPCSCGRGLPAIEMIMGRQCNLLTSPDGKLKYFPILNGKLFCTMADVRQYQVIQTSLTELQVRLVVGEPVTQQQELRLTNHINSSLGHSYKINFVYVGKMDTKAGKFEVVKSNLP